MQLRACSIHVPLTSNVGVDIGGASAAAVSPADAGNVNGSGSNTTDLGDAGQEDTGTTGRHDTESD